MREQEPKFDPAHVECAQCHDIIFSKYQGQFVSCKCGAISVDQTAYYSRYLGDRKNFIFKEIDDDNRSKQESDRL